VNQIIAGTNITITNGGSGSVTINSSGGGGTFPFTGDAVISGSLVVTASTAATYALDVLGDVRTSDRYYLGDLTKFFSGQVGNPLYIRTSGNSISFNNGTAVDTVMGRFQSTTGNFTLQGGPVIADNGYKFQIWNTGSFAGANGAMWVSGSSIFSGSVNVPVGGITGSFSGSLRAPGTVNEILYNSASVIGAAANVEISTAGNLLLIATADPATPAADSITMYSKTIAGRTLPKVKGPSGLDYVLQPALFQNANYIWTQTNATAGSWMGTVGAGSGSFTNTLPTVGGGTFYTSQKRALYSNVVTTANQVLGQRNTEALFWRGSITGLGGFFFYARFGFDTWTNGGRLFVGMATATTVITSDPSSLNNTVGFSIDAADTGAIKFLTRSTTATKTNLTAPFTASTGKGYDAFIFCRPNDTFIYYRIVDLITLDETSGGISTTLPSNTTTLTSNVLASNAALTAANAVRLGVSKIYIETDY